MQLNRSFLAVCVASLCIVGCGEDDDKRGSTDGKSALGSTPGCGAGMEPPDIEGCSDAEVRGFAACVTEACEETYRTCYGPNYASGIYGGACGSYLSCASECGCDDGSCTDGCEGYTACGDCILEHPCGTQCVPSCTAPKAKHTCDELSTCCRTTRDPQTCNSIVTMARRLGGQADFTCGEIYDTLCLPSGR